MPALYRCCRTDVWDGQHIEHGRQRVGGRDCDRMAPFAVQRDSLGDDHVQELRRGRLGCRVRHRMDRRRWLARRCALAAPCNRAPWSRRESHRRRRVHRPRRAAEGASRGRRAADAMLLVELHAPRSRGGLQRETGGFVGKTVNCLRSYRPYDPSGPVQPLVRHCREVVGPRAPRLGQQAERLRRLMLRLAN